MKKQERELTVAVVALVISLMAALFTCLQWWEARQTRIDVHNEAESARQLAVMQFNTQRADAKTAAQAQQKDVEQSAGAADRSAKAAEKSVLLADRALEINQKLFQISERARVHIKAVALSLQSNAPIKALLTIENFGKTPANRLEVTATLETRADALPDNPQDDPSIHEHPSTNLMPSDIHGMSLIGARPMSDAGVTAINEGKGFVYVFGHMEYEDVFGKAHKTTFCAQYNPKVPDQFNFCAYYNSAD